MDPNILNTTFFEYIDKMILIAGQPILGYFMPNGKRIAFIIYIYTGPLA